MLAGASTQGICLFEFVDETRLTMQLSRLKKKSGAKVIAGHSPLFEQLNIQVQEYFAGQRKKFDLPLHMIGTDFQIRVWQALLTIPYGKTVSYQHQAQVINNPKAVRAVAKTNGDNRIALLIPCHRVIGKNGNMTGYGGEVWRKEYLLNLETTTK